MASGNILKSIGAVAGGIVVIFFLSHVTDLILEKTGLMKIPFEGNPVWLMLFVTVYRNVYVVAGGYVAAALAPAKPMHHAIILACLGTVLGILGAIVMWDHGPHWYPVALIILGWPAAWFGGWLRAKRS